LDLRQIEALLEQVRDREIGVDEAVEQLRHLPFEDLGFAKIDHHRALRHGMPEVIFAQGKTAEQVASIAGRLLERNRNVLATRVSGEIARHLAQQFPSSEYFADARSWRVWEDRTVRGKGTVAIVCAGTSDVPVAREAAITAEVMGNRVDEIYDVGVAGIHRLLQNKERITGARVIVVCAGMEGALPSVVGGITGCPVIAVPTSIGYGASFDGLAALLGMMNSCASNVSVVNIDNGFGGGYVASLINRL